MWRHNPLISCTGTPIIPLKLKLYDEKGAHLQMGNQLDFDIGSHGKLLDSHTSAALEQQSLACSLHHLNRVNDHGEVLRLRTGLGSSKNVS